MNTVIGKQDLLEIIKENKGKHRDIFLKAIDGYRLTDIEMKRLIFLKE